MNWTGRARAVALRLHWSRGLRAGVAVASAMLACRILGQPTGWAALGGFESVLVDNGGPYRSRFHTILAVLLGGALCGLAGSLTPSAASSGMGLLSAAAVTAAVCFVVTFLRVASQPIANTSVIILVLYFAGFGSSGRTPREALGNLTAYVIGGLWAAAIGLLFWPADPFRPARLEVAAAYEQLGQFTAALVHAHHSHREAPDATVNQKRQIRAKLESARAALTSTPARAPARTIRARNLSVLLETADMLFAAQVRLAELSELDSADPQMLTRIAEWLTGAERTIAHALRDRPADGADSFAAEGSQRLQWVIRPAEHLRADQARLTSAPHEWAHHALAEQREAIDNVELAMDAVSAVWTGRDLGPGWTERLASLPSAVATATDWRAAILENWTLDSTMMRHALRMAAVGLVDVLLMHFIHVPHGFWLAMTSIIVLQPYSSGTLRKSAQRVGGTIAGGLLAAGLAAIIHTYTGIILVITACSVLTLATYAVDYGWYSFFLTPTFVLMSLPYLRDWRYAGVRILTTLLGAAAAVLAMRFLWPESLRLEIAGLLARAVETSAEYLRALLRYWDVPTETRSVAEREILAPARRACGLSSQDAEEALDRAMQETLPGALGAKGGSSKINEAALTCTTYLRRLAQCATTLAAVGQPAAQAKAQIDTLITRLEQVADGLLPGKSGAAKPSPPSFQDPCTQEHDHSGDPLVWQMLRRMDRQIGVLQRATYSITENADKPWPDSPQGNSASSS